VLFTSCNEVKVERITIDAVDVELAISGDYSKRQINAVAMPTNATNKKLNFFLANTESQEYITVNSTGLIQSLGKETPEEVVCVVRINSVSTPSVHVDINVTVKVGSIERIQFEQSEISVRLDSNGYQLTPIIQPAYAASSSTLTYLSTNEEIATVSESGFVTPKSKGVTNIEVFSNIIHSLGASATIRIKVMYAPLNYSLRVRDNIQSIYKQIIDVPENFTLEVFMNNDELCDPAPEIIWQRNGSAIQGGNFQGQKVADIKPSDIGMTTVGEHVIRVILKSVDNEQILTLPTINIYNPLTTFNVVKLDAGNEFNLGDSIAFRANHGAGQYPPDSYVWNLLNVNDFGDKIYTDASLKLKELWLDTTLPQNYEDRDVGLFNFTPTEVGEYYIVGYPSVNGVRQDSSRRIVYVGRVGSSTAVSDISGVYFDGYKRGDTYLPYVRWNALPYDGEINVTIKNLTDPSRTMVLSSYTDSNYFPTHNGVLIPASVASFAESFSVKIKSAKYSYSQEYIYEQGSITSAQYQYFEESNDVNRYIANMEELGQLLNYIATFRPDAYKTSQFNGTASNYAYLLNIYIPFTYESIKDSYDKNGTATTLDNSDAGKLIWVAFNCFVDTSKVEFLTSYDGSGGVILEINYFDDIEFNFESTETSNFLERPTVTHYTNSPGKRVLPIDDLPSERAMVVTTSNQLYYAVTHGYKPSPVQGSPAATIYDLAKEVLYRIIDSSMNDAQKIHAIYDYLTYEIFYDYTLTENLSTYTNPYIYDGFYLEGVFIHNKAVCDGISKAFSLLSWMEGIMTLRVSGKITSSGDTQNHAWNTTFIAGFWYASDATWGNVRENPLVGANYEHSTHSYLLVSNEILEANGHTPFGLIPETTNGSYEILGKTIISVQGLQLSLRISSQTDINNIANYVANVLAPHKDEAHDIWIELYFDAVYIADFDNVTACASYAGSILESSLKTSLQNAGISISFTVGADGQCILYTIKIPVLP
jgi:hypothetical protein